MRHAWSDDAEDLLERAGTICLAIREVSDEQRVAWLAARCGGDVRLEHQVLLLLDAERELSSFLQPPQPPHLHDDLGGHLVGTCFVLGRRLVVGEHDAVYTARQLGVEREVAVKLLGTGIAGTLERWQREAHAVADIRHPNLVEVYAAGFDEELRCGYYAMRLVRGESLWSVLRTRAAHPGVLSRDMVRILVQLVVDAAAAVAALHAAGRVHGDLSPGNVLVEPPDPLTTPARAYVVDYGQVRPIGAAVTRAVGTPGYLAPEILDTNTVAATSDVYALGVLLHDLLAGVMLADAGCVPGRFGQRVSAEAVARAVGGRDGSILAAVVQRATHHEPASRYPDAGFLLGDLEAWMAGRPTKVAEGERRRRHRFRIVTGAALALLVAAAIWVRSSLDREVRVMLARADLLGLADWQNGFEGWLGHALQVRGASPPVADPVIADVLEAARLGPEAALQNAAAHVERDGLDAHPLLSRFLLRSAETPTLAPITMACLGRIFVDRPDRTQQAVAVSAPCRAVARAHLAAGVASVRTWAVVILGGCGVAADVAPLFAVALATGTLAPEEEMARLALHAVRRIVARAEDCGFDVVVSRHAWAESLHDLVPIVNATSEGTGVRLELQGLLVELAARWRGVDPSLVQHLCDHDNHVGGMFLRAVAGRPAARAWLEEPIVSAADRTQIRVQIAERALVAYLLDDAVASEHAATVWGRAARDHGISEDELASIVDYGERMLRTHVDAPGAWPARFVGTHLGAMIGFSNRPFIPLACQAGELSKSTLAQWDFFTPSVGLGGGARAPVQRAAFFRRDELFANERHLLLSVPGVSEVCMPFVVERANEEPLVLRLVLRRDNRQPLPELGQALLDIAIDDFTTRLEVTRTHGMSVPIVTRRFAPGRHLVRLRLTGESSTGVRLRRAYLNL